MSFQPQPEINEAHIPFEGAKVAVRYGSIKLVGTVVESRPNREGNEVLLVMRGSVEQSDPSAFYIVFTKGKTYVPREL